MRAAGILPNRAPPSVQIAEMLGLFRGFQNLMVGKWLAQAGQHFLRAYLPEFAAAAIPIFQQ